MSELQRANVEMRLPNVVEFTDVGKAYDFTRVMEDVLGVRLDYHMIGLVKHRQKFLFSFYLRGSKPTQQEENDAMKFWCYDNETIIAL